MGKMYLKEPWATRHETGAFGGQGRVWVLQRPVSPLARRTSHGHVAVERHGGRPARQTWLSGLLENNGQWGWTLTLYYNAAQCGYELKSPSFLMKMFISGSRSVPIRKNQGPRILPEPRRARHQPRLGAAQGVHFGAMRSSLITERAALSRGFGLAPHPPHPPTHPPSHPEGRPGREKGKRLTTYVTSKARVTLVDAAWTKICVHSTKN